MNICMISAYNKPCSGGLESVVAELSSYMIQQGAKVTICYESEKDLQQAKEGFTSLEVKPYSVPKLLQHGFYNKVAYSLKTRLVLGGLNKFDVIHGHGENCFFNSLFRFDTPFVMTFHGTRAMFIPKKEPRNLAAFYAEKLAANYCDVAVACSYAVKEEIDRFYGVSGKKVIVIHNGVDVDRFKPMNKLLARERLGLPVDKVYALWVGLAPHRKGLPVVLDTLKQFPNVHLLVVGYKMADTRQATFLGKVSSESLVDAYNAADFLFFPTKYEGFPVAPMEALACGLPIVVSKESNMGEVVSNGTQGFVVDNGCYSDKIACLVEDSEFRGKMSLNCRDLALHYSWSSQASKYYELYRKVVGV